MSSHPSPPLSIKPATIGYQADALHLLFAHLEEQERSAVVTHLMADAVSRGESIDGLFVGYRGEERVGAAWGQLQPGATAVLWPVSLIEGEPESTAVDLLRTIDRYLSERQVRMAQAMLAIDASSQGDQLRAAGFSFLTRLLYMASAPSSFLQDARETGLTFEAYHPSQRNRLAELVQKTYAGSLDCPGLEGIRNMQDVLSGYQETGVFAPERWIFVQHQGSDVGCLLLADHPAAGQWELVYMGLIPAARGQGFGRQMVHQAQRLTSDAGRSRLVLAVDADNRFAVRMYQACDFVVWTERDVFIKSYPGE